MRRIFQGGKPAVRSLVRVARSRHYRADAWHLLGNGCRWLASMVPGPLHHRPTSLLDNRPLKELLAPETPFPSIRQAVNEGILEALTVTAVSYVGQFVRGETRTRALGASTEDRRCRDINVQHVIASAPIPFVFPATRINGEYFGDGAVRQVAPTAPALHLGADRILVIGAARGIARSPVSPSLNPPSVAEVGSQVLASIFTDALATDWRRCVSSMAPFGRSNRRVSPAVPSRPPARCSAARHYAERRSRNDRGRADEILAKGAAGDAAARRRQSAERGEHAVPSLVRAAIQARLHGARASGRAGKTGRNSGLPGGVAPKNRMSLFPRTGFRSSFCLGS